MTTIDDQGIILIMMKKIESLEATIKYLDTVIQSQTNTIKSLENLLSKDINQLEY